VDYLQVKNLEKYQPHYKDQRKIIWIRWDIEAHRDYKISKLDPKQRWLFIGLTCLACKCQNLVPNDPKWISDELNYNKSHISNDINKLQTLELLVTKCDKMSQDVTKCDVQTDRQTYITDMSQDVTSFFNYFSLKTKTALKLDSTRSAIIRKRLTNHSLDELKRAVDNFILDDWADRKKFIDIVYCIGIRNKIDNLERWLNYKPKPKVGTVRGGKVFYE